MFEILDDKCQYVRRRSGEEFHPQCLVKTVKHPISVMVWSMISFHGVGPLRIVEGRMNQHQYIDILEKNLLPQLPINFPDGGFIFQQDGAPCHRARSVTNFLNCNNVPILPWTGNSPDMNPIENLWMIVKKRIADRKPSTKVALIEALIEVWTHDPEIQDMCPRLIDSMPNRVEKLIAARGASTKY